MNARTGNKLRMAKVERKTYVQQRRAALDGLVREAFEKLTEKIGYAIKRDFMRSTMGRTYLFSYLA